MVLRSLPRCRAIAEIVQPWRRNACTSMSSSRVSMSRGAPLSWCVVRWSLTTHQLKGAPLLMLTREDDIDVHALRRQGWTISAIARHLGRDRKTIRGYLAGERQAGVRAPRRLVDSFEAFAPYCAQRLKDDPHLWASALFDELLELGYDRSYPTMTRQLRARGLRPACEPCRPTKDRAVALIEHPPGEETQWDWVELPDPPKAWGWGKNAHLLVGALAHSGRWRAVLCESEDQPHLIDGLDRISHALGGLTRDWRFDRMATVISPQSGKVSASFS